ncbi:nuclear transport factor 2 family protein [Maribellus sediminis]|uniref:nuclear transport factor 2 family protein n=1 Tax=Maribellus sediminis TaxID=2696285 RepID=UPI001430E274|nr:nuclear transport factor 2 family protein [Maribellus sediminis]
MKKILSLFTLVVLFCGFTTVPKSSDEEKAMQSITGFYDAMKVFDYDGFDKYCADDFSVIDAGVYYKNLDEFKAQVKNYESATIEKISLEPFKSDFDGKQGLILLKFTIDGKFQGENLHVVALENYVMEKEHGNWLIAFCQSTPIEG